MVSGRTGILIGAGLSLAVGWHAVGGVDRPPRKPLARSTGVTDPKPARPEPGRVYYFDGAGGGGLLNWGRSIRRGLERGGFRGDFEEIKWQTGLGPLVDHGLSEESKRDEAREAVGEIVAYMDRHPDAPVHLLGLSAGTAVLLHVLELLPEKRAVDQVVLLSSSVSSDYDLSRALLRVRGRMYVFTSEHDPLLSTLVPMVGTADRDFPWGGAAGLRGFHPPRPAAPQRSLYAKLVHVPWRPSFARYGNLGSHTGPTNSDFVARFIEPLLQGATGRRVSSRPSPSPGDYGRAGR